ncbi:MAG: leucyl aminopeptidase [Candidatus Woesearchaeota archaeon]|jgi:leucyl aminopeptidase|nr:leucyl aminopeptidase [Candidatus Woesearchaeota archaeon]
MTPEIIVNGKKLEEIKDQCLGIAFFEDNLKLRNEIKNLDNSINNAIGNSIKNKDFKAEKNEVKTFYINKNIKYLALLGLGKENDFDLNKLMDATSNLSKKLRNSGIETFSLALNSFKNKNYEHDIYLEKITQAITLSLYQFTKFKTRDLDKIKSIKKVTIILDNEHLKNSEKIANEASIYAEAVNKTRDLINTPPNIATPDYVATAAADAGKKNGIKCTILDEKQIEKLRMGCIMAVARGSSHKPRIFVLEYNGNGNEMPIVLVGKGVTFDTGGINIKPSSYLTTMKDDKAGACGIINILEACARLKLKLNVIGIGALAENMIGSSSYRPDDVLKSHSGLTVEIVNTDAEGRLLVADALSYSLKYKPQAVIDVATLTGASIVALGYFASPVLGNDQKLIDKIKAASEKSLEKIWQFPLWDEYKDLIKSDIADIRHHHGGIDAGVMVGGIFLKNFVKDVPWAHIDIGNTVWAKQEKGYTVKGATGFSVLLLLNLLRDWK